MLLDGSGFRSRRGSGAEGKWRIACIDRPGRRIAANGAENAECGSRIAEWGVNGVILLSGRSPQISRAENAECGLRIAEWGVNGVILLSGRSPRISRAETRNADCGLRNGGSTARFCCPAARHKYREQKRGMRNADCGMGVNGAILLSGRSPQISPAVLESLATAPRLRSTRSDRRLERVRASILFRRSPFHRFRFCE